eukprot:scaffold1513_cov100-Amphora_coffeaeformis.AAC.10
MIKIVVVVVVKKRALEGTLLVRWDKCGMQGRIFLVLLFGWLLLGTPTAHFLFPTFHVDEPGKEMNGGLFGIERDHFSPRPVFAPLRSWRFGFLEPRNEWIRSRGEVSKIRHRVTLPTIASTLDVILIWFGDERVGGGTMFDVFEFKGRLVKDTTNALGLFVNVDAQNEVNGGSHGGLDRNLAVTQVDCGIEIERACA